MSFNKTFFSHILMYPLTDLFNLSLSSSSIPSIWKCAKTIPLFKSGDTSYLNSYCPISIICTVAKVFEKLIFNQISNYINHFNILSPFQSGFRPNFSTTTALMKFNNDLFTSFEKCQPIGAIFIDLSKAFDLMDHYLLLDKLHSLGFDQNSLLWFNSYLHNRRQSVSFKARTRTIWLLIRVFTKDQHLVLCFFVYFLMHFPKTCLHSSIPLYANDAVIYSSHSDISYIQSSLQSDFNSLKDWFYKNKLVLNKKKSCSMVFFKICHRPHSFDLYISF